MSTWGTSWLDSWGASWGASEPAGIGLADDPGIGLATPLPHQPVDFVFSDGYMIGFRPFSRARQMRVAMRQNSELGEMHALYANWRKAA